MIARISCRLMSKLTPVRACTPPKDRVMLSTLSSVSPTGRVRSMTSGGLAAGGGGVCRRRFAFLAEALRLVDAHMAADGRAAAVLEPDFHLHVEVVALREQRLDQHLV